MMDFVCFMSCPSFMMPDSSAIWEYLLRKGIKTYKTGSKMNMHTE